MNKRKIITTAVMLLTLLTVLFSLSACDKIISLEKAEIVCSEGSGTYEIGEFDYGDYTLVLTYSDGSKVTRPLTESMLSDYDKLKLKSPGKHTFTIKYENKTVNLPVTVIRKQVVTDDDTTAPYLANLMVKYDGKPHTLSVAGDVPEGATVLYPYGNTFTDAGSYPVTATVQADGYETVVLSATLTIEKSDYVFVDFAIVPDYGTETGGTPMTAFVYDGLSHGVKMVGTYPSQLGEPKFQIVNTDEKTAAFVDGNSATDAGHYHVIATFSGDEKNYRTNNLTYDCYFEITKKPISVEVLNAISFEDLTIDYDAKPHRIDIGKVELPAGISVGYYTEDGVTPFGTRTDVGEYDVIAKFQSDNPNLEIINELTAHLSIQQVNYVNVDLLHIGFLDESTELTFDGVSHELKVFGLNKNVTVKKFVWNKSDNPEDDVEITSLTDVLVNDNGQAVSYKVTAYFNTPTDPNHKAVDPISAELKINKGVYFAPEYVFESVTGTYSENETFSLSFTQTSLPAGMKAVLYYTMPGKAELFQGLPSVTCLPYDSTTPKQNYGVGVYTCTLTFDYNPDNYVDAPAFISPEIRTLEITVRSYDAQGIITVRDVRADYAVGVNQLSLCSFSEAIPDWVSDVYLKLAVLQGTEEELFEVTNAGTYEYFFRFSYFNGKETVTADTKSAELKVVGLPIYDRYYSVTYGSVFTYDGVTDCLPTATIAEEVTGILSVKCKYTFAEPGSTEFVTVYEGAGDNNSLTANADCLATAKRAGSHKFVFTIEGENFEPLTVGVTLTVNPKKLEISHANWILKSSTTEVTYDAKDHSGAYSFVTEPPAEEMAIVSTSPKLLTSVTNGQKPGVDVGEYTYTLVFSASDKNYYIEAEDEAYFTYKVKINPLLVSSSGEPDYQPAGFFYYKSNTSERYLIPGFTSYSSTYISDSPLYNYVKTYGIKVSEGTYTMPQWKTDEVNWYSSFDLEMFYSGMNNDSENEQIALLNKALSEDVTVVVLRPNGKTQTFNGLANHSITDTDVTKDLCSEIDASLCGDYVVMMILNSENVMLDGSRIFAFHVTIKTLEVESKNVLNKAAAGIFEGFSASQIPVTEEKAVVDSFVGLPMFVEDDRWFVTGDYLTSNLYSANPFDKSEIKKNKSYILYCDYTGTVQQYEKFQTVFEFNTVDDDRLYRPGSTFTQAGYYYLFVDLGPNVIVKEKNGQVIPDLHRFVVCIKVKPCEVSAADLVTLKDSAGTTYDQSATRRYQTDASSVTYKYGTSAIANVDTVSGTNAFAGQTVHTFETLYNGKKFSLNVLPKLSDLMKSCVKYTIKIESYSFAEGGAKLSASRTYSNTGLSYQDVTNELAGLYSTENAKNSKITSVGLYYVFLSVEGDDLLCDGNKTLIVTVKIDRPENDAMYKYTMDTKTYDLRTASAFPIEKLAWNKLTGSPLTVSDTIRTAIKAQTPVISVQCDPITVSNDPKNIGTHNIHATFTYNTDVFGGLSVSGDYPFIEVTKATINLSNLIYIGDITYQESSWNGQTIIFDLKDRIKTQLINLGMESTGAGDMASRVFSYMLTQYSPFTKSDGTAITKIGESGEFWFTPTFHLQNNDSLFAKYEFVGGDNFTKSGNTYTPNDYYKSKIFVESSTDRKLILTEGTPATWPTISSGNALVSNPLEVVKCRYNFIGFYSETGNDFYNSLLNYMTASEADAWILNHVTVENSDYRELKVTINVENDNSKYVFCVNTWKKTGENSETNKAIGTISKRETLTAKEYSFTFHY